MEKEKKKRTIHALVIELEQNKYDTKIVSMRMAKKKIELKTNSPYVINL